MNFTVSTAYPIQLPSQVNWSVWTSAGCTKWPTCSTPQHLEKDKQPTCCWVTLEQVRGKQKQNKTKETPTRSTPKCFGEDRQPDHHQVALEWVGKNEIHRKKYCWPCGWGGSSMINDQHTLVTLQMLWLPLQWTVIDKWKFNRWLDENMSTIKRNGTDLSYNYKSSSA